MTYIAEKVDGWDGVCGTHGKCGGGAWRSVWRSGGTIRGVEANGASTLQVCWWWGGWLDGWVGKHGRRCPDCPHGIPASGAAAQVSHHPPIGAGHGETELWSYDLVSAPKTKFLGNSVEIYPIGRRSCARRALLSPTHTTGPVWPWPCSPAQHRAWWGCCPAASPATRAASPTTAQPCHLIEVQFLAPTALPRRRPTPCAPARAARAFTS